jgi:hypothetical protein
VQRLPAVHIGQSKVQQHEVWVVLACHGDASGRRVAGENIVPGGPQQLGRQRQVSRHVFDDEDGGHLGLPGGNRGVLLEQSKERSALDRLVEVAVGKIRNLDGIHD